MRKCDYCAKEIGNFDQYCCEECEKLTVEYYRRSEKYTRLFTIVNTVCVFGIPVGMFLMAFSVVGAYVAGVSCVVLGSMLIWLPMPTEGMIKKHKLKKAMKMARIFGIAVIALAVPIVVLRYIM